MAQRIFTWDLSRRIVLMSGLILATACGGKGGSNPSALPNPTTIITIRYLRVDPAYNGWGLHLWGNAIDAGVATKWDSPRAFDRLENGAALFEIPVVNATGDLQMVVHNGDLKSPVFDLTLMPQSEPPRVYRRLHFLRGWSYEQVNEIFAGSSRTGCPAGV